MALNTEIFPTLIDKLAVFRVDPKIPNMKQSFKIYTKERLQEQVYILLLAFEKEIQSLQTSSDDSPSKIVIFRQLLNDRFFPGFNDLFQ